MQSHLLRRARPAAAPSVLTLLVLAACAGPGPGEGLPPAAAVAETPAAEASVKPGINETYLDPELDVDAMVRRFEVESREIAAHRDAIVAAVGIEPGTRMADIGAGTGLFLEPFAAAVGPEGRLFAVDLAAPFVEHLAERAAAAGLEQVEARRCSEDSVGLPPGSIELAFVCDTYHHFEYPRSTSTSILQALVPGGELFLVDFERIPGVSREWLLEHVRAGKQEVIAELESFGFELVEEVEIEGLEENYALRLRKP
jgi:predicted methyltransferase